MMPITTPPPSSSPTESEPKPSQTSAPQNSAKRHLDDLETCQDPVPKRQQHEARDQILKEASVPGLAHVHHLPAVEAVVQPPPPTSASATSTRRKAKATSTKASKPQQAANALAKAALAAPSGQPPAAPYEVITWQSSVTPFPETTPSRYGMPTGMPPLRPSDYAEHWPFNPAWHGGFVDPQRPWLTTGPPPTFAAPTSLTPQPYAYQSLNISSQPSFAQPANNPTVQQKHEYHVPSLASTFVQYPAQASHALPHGSASHPIVLDDSTPSARNGPLTPAVGTNSQMLNAALPVSTPTSTFHENKENEGNGKFVAYPPPASQLATVGKQPSAPTRRQPLCSGPAEWPTPQSGLPKTSIHTSSGTEWAVGLMGKMGYVPGRGLGVDSQGRHYPVEARSRPDPQMHPGLGVYAEMSTQQRLDEIRQTMLRGGDPQYLMPTQPTVYSAGVAAKPPPTKGRKRKAPVLSDEPALCPEQAALVDLIVKGNNVFYTGSAGCGKSTVLRAFVKQLRDMGKTVRIAAPTGRAALNVGGSTTWTFAGLTPDSHKLPLERLKGKAMFGNIAKKRLKETDVLVIDEISMVENLHFERLNEVMKAARHDPHTRPQPFGGCQIVVTGDFCQLPPVKPFQHCIKCGKELIQKTAAGGKLVYQCRDHGLYADEDKWAFRSQAWEDCDFTHVHLKTVHRQNDQTFIRMLQKCRLGEALEESEINQLLNHKCRVAQATKLFCTKREAETVNQAAFDKLVGVTHPYWAQDRIKLQQTHQHLSSKGRRGQWRNTWKAPPPTGKLPLACFDEHRFGECVSLKKGMLVVLLANIDLDAGLCNGSQGTVCGFEDYDPEMTPVKEMRESLLGFGEKGKKEYVPVKPGQRALRGEHAALMEHEIKEFIKSESAPIKKWPVVRFHNGIKRTVYAECSVTQLGDEEPYSLISRTQIPLAPAWAMTVHKSQSLTLDRVIVNLDRAFEEGQVYVALSRATGLEGLKIEGDGSFLRNKLMVNAEVAAFLKEKFGDIYKATEADDARS